MKWIIIGIVITICVGIYTGNLGQTSKNGTKYNKMMSTKGIN